MRHIPLLKHQPPGDLLKKAEKATAQIEAETDPEVRKKLIEKRAKIWSCFKDWLLELSDQKCWFSEAKDCFQDWDVEHFRPKKSAKNLDGTEREGYWWLSFHWKNLRICGRVGNNKKGTFFPLAPTSFIANSANRDIVEEIPYLLDPIKKTDCALLSFNQLGEAIPAPGLEDWDKTRVTTSVDRYKLDFEKLELQRKTVWETCTSLINEIQNLMLEQSKNQGSGKQARIEEKMEQLSSLTNRKNAFSSVAIVCLQKSELSWAQRLSAEEI
jgi:hypothetical protein